MPIEFFILMAVLSVAYMCMRFAVVWYLQLPPIPKEPTDYTGNAIKMEELSSRVQQVRGAFQEPKPASQTNSFKRELLVASKREQVAKLSFFQNPPPPAPEPQDPEHGIHLLLA